MADERPRYRQYILDDFQIEAFREIDRGNNVLCCAPTGSGKTLLAEYLVERTLASGTGEVIYTAPIKALSNQKFRDFKALYGDEKVGIVTGDVVHNPDAPILLMTTEIYRNIMYDDPERLTRVKHVVFDEVHYLEDEKRGTVWEESLMLSPRHIRFLMLSATVANADQIAAWLSEVRGVPTVHIAHETRPVPLTLGFFVEGAGFFKKEKLAAAIAAAKGPDGRGDRSRRPGPPRRRGGMNILDWLVAEEKLPALHFCFSRRLCESLAQRYAAYPLNGPEEADEAARYFDDYAAARDLARFPSVAALRQLVTAGVCYHHAGMLPGVKEAIEVLFGRGLVKLLFATETFAVGINMPARTVVFSSLEKNDGVAFRYLRRYEFQQMSGRAGRRGIDEVGHVVVNLEPKYARLAETRETVFGPIEPLRSRFGFSYSSLLNLYARHGVEEIKELARVSLAGRQMDGRRELVGRDIERLEAEMAEMACTRGKGSAATQIEEFQALDARLDAARSELDDCRRALRRGDLPRRDGEHRLHELAEEIELLRKRLAKNRCRKCFSGSRCRSVMERLAMRRRERATLRYEMVDAVDRKFDLLGRLGYVDGKGRLPRGDFASDIFGYELQCTELLFDGYFGRLAPREICALVSTITFESRHERVARRVGVRALRAPVADFLRRVEEIRALETRIVGEPQVPQADSGFVDIAWEWAGGVAFEALLSHEPDWTEGDLIRQLRQSVDLLRQVKRAVRRDAAMHDKIGACLELINRDVVDAEKYL